MDQLEALASLVFGLMCGVQPIEHIYDYRGSYAAGNANLPFVSEMHQVGQRFAVNVFHHNEQLTLVNHDIQGLNYVWVPNSRRQTSFINQHGYEDGVTYKRRMQPLDGNRAREARSSAQSAYVNRRHPTHANFVEKGITLRDDAFRS